MGVEHDLQHARGVPAHFYNRIPVKFFFGGFRFSADYDTPGEDFELPIPSQTIVGVIFFETPQANRAVYNTTTGNIQAFVKATGAEVADNTDLSAEYYPFMAIFTGPR